MHEEPPHVVYSAEERAHVKILPSNLWLQYSRETRRLSMTGDIHMSFLPELDIHVEQID